MMERIFRCRDVSSIRGPFALAWSAAKLFTEPFEIVLRPLKAKRSVDQNRRYWALLREVAATVWVGKQQFSDEVWHEYFRQIFIGTNEIVLPDGAMTSRPISTTTLTVEDMSRYMDEIANWCTEHGFPLEEAA